MFWRLILMGAREGCCMTVPTFFRHIDLVFGSSRGLSGLGRVGNRRRRRHHVSNRFLPTAARRRCRCSNEIVFRIGDGGGNGGSSSSSSGENGMGHDRPRSRGTVLRGCGREEEDGSEIGDSGSDSGVMYRRNQSQTTCNQKNKSQWPQTKGARKNVVVVVHGWIPYHNPHVGWVSSASSLCAVPRRNRAVPCRAVVEGTVHEPTGEADLRFPTPVLSARRRDTKAATHPAPHRFEGGVGRCVAGVAGRSPSQRPRSIVWRRSMVEATTRARNKQH